MVGFRDTVIGFRLLGIEGTIIEDLKSEKSIDQIKDTIKELQKRSGPGLIIINEKISDQLEEFILNIKINHEKVIIMDIPDRTGSTRPVLDLNYIMSKVVGMKI